MDRFFELLKNSEEYIPNFIITNTGIGSYHIQYVYYTYDLIDKDLDFDEAWYSEMIKRLNQLIVVEAKTIMKRKRTMNQNEFEDINSIRIEISKMSRRDFIAIESIYNIYSDHIVVTCPF
jgi:hypothetical protein